MNAPAQVSVTVNWAATAGQISPRVYGLNLWNGTDPSKASNATYQSNVRAIAPGVLRLHSAEMILHPSGNGKSWVNTSGGWQSSVVDSVLTSFGPGREIMITVPDWSSTLDLAGSGGQLNPTNITIYANHVAALVDLANNQLGHNVTWIETFNERDNSYNGDSAALAAVHNAVTAAVRAVDPTIKVAAGAWIQPFDDADIKDFMAAVGSANMDAFTYHHYATSGTSTDRTLLYDRANNGSSSVGGKGSGLRGWLDAIPGGSNVELWLGETNLYSNFANDTQGLMRGAVGGVWDALMMTEAIRRGELDVILPWNDSDNTFGKISSNGATLRPAGEVRKLLAEHFVGNRVTASSSNKLLVDVLAVAESGQRAIMLANRSLSAATVDLSTLDLSQLADGYTIFTVSGAGVTQTTGSLATGPPGAFPMAIDTVSFLLFDVVSPTGDYNLDGAIDASDYTLWRDTLGQTVPRGTGADGNANRLIDQGDLAFWQNKFGSTPAVAAGAVVPEPATCAIAVVALLFTATVFTARCGRRRVHSSYGDHA